VNSNRLPAVARSKETITAKIAEKTVAAISATMRNFRLSTISASAPAGTANRNIGRVVATWTMETTSGCGSRLVISQPDAALYIQLPMLATTVATHSTVYSECRNGLHGEVVGPADACARVMGRKRRTWPPSKRNRENARPCRLRPQGNRRVPNCQRNGET
jgi:hypothetical protein